MKSFLFLLAVVYYLALSGAVLAKPTANRNENLLNKLLAFEQDDSNNGRVILAQDDNDETTLKQADNEDGGIIVLEQDEADDSIRLQEDDEGKGVTHVQEGGDDGEAVMIQNFGKLLKKTNKKVVLAEVQALKASAQSEAEVQWWHHIFHFFHHLFHHHHHHHHGHHHHHW